MATVHPVSLPSVSPLTLKHILVTTDFSECSLRALKQAAALARLHGADLLLLHVISPDPIMQNSFEPPTWEYEDILRQAKSQMKSAEHDEILADVVHELKIDRGGLNDILLSLIKDREISLLVLGTHGRSGFKKLLLGSVAEQIFRMAPCPVLTVGPKEAPSLLTHGRFQSILFATDFSEASTQALRYAVAFAQESQAKLTCMHVVEESSVTALYLHERLIKDSRERLETLLPANVGFAFPLELEVTSGYTVDEIMRVAAQKEADLIVMGAHRSSRLGAVAAAHLPWTIAQAIACQAHCPVLTVRG